MIRIILAGQFRGNALSFNSLKLLKEHHNAIVYVGSPEIEKWKLPFDFKSTKTHKLEDTIFNDSLHIHKERYISQWSSLYSTYNKFKDEFLDDDIIIKLRNDFMFDVFDVKAEENTIYTPEKEYHCDAPFDKDFLCNDQILYGYKNTMEKYFNLPYRFNYKSPFNNGCSRSWKWCTNITRPNITKTRGDIDFGIEEMIRSYLYQQNIKLETFKLLYDKVI